MECICETCCFVGHRTIEVTPTLLERLKSVIEDLIVNKNVIAFMFGSRSEFDSLCHSVVTGFKEKYPHIKRIACTCKNEGFVLESEREAFEKFYSKLIHEEVHILGFEEEYNFKTKYSAGKASYVERNQAMIENSKYCIFYYDENYKPEIRKMSKRSISCYQPKSGTRLAYGYAIKKKKKIVLINKDNEDEKKER